MAETKLKRHPIRAALYGLMLGLSIWYFLQFEFASFPLDSVGGVITKAAIVVVATMAVSVAWAYLAPARKPKGSAPAEVAASPTAFVETPTAGALPSEDE